MTTARPRARGMGSVPGSAAARASGVGKLRHPSSVGLPCSATTRPSTVRAPLTEICWPTTVRTAVSKPSTEPGERSPGRVRTTGPRTAVGAEDGVDRDRVGVQVEQAADAGHDRHQIADVAEAHLAAHGALAGRDRHQRRAPWGRDDAAEHAGLVGLQTRHGVRAEEVQDRGERHRLAVGQLQDHRARLGAFGAGRAARGPQPRRGGGEDLADGVVELADAGEPGGEGDIGDREGRGLQQHPCSLRALRPGQRQRPGADLGDQQAVQLPLGVAEPAGQAGHAVAVDDAVADQPQRPAGDVGAQVPVRRAGGGVRPAPLAGPEAGALRGGGAGMEGDVAAAGSDRRAGRPAVDAGGADGGEEPAVEPGIARGDGPVADVLVRQQHVLESAPPVRQRLAVSGHRGRRVQAGSR